MALFFGLCDRKPFPLPNAAGICRGAAFSKVSNTADLLWSEATHLAPFHVSNRERCKGFSTKF